MQRTGFSHFWGVLTVGYCMLLFGNVGEENCAAKKRRSLILDNTDGALRRAEAL